MARKAAYRKAEEKIKEARRSAATELALNRMHLTELPESLGQLTQLQTLDISNNQLTELPGSLGQLTRLQTLDISNNQLTELPESLGQLTQLRTLYTYGSELTELPESLGQLTQLRTLHTSNNQLTELPESLGQLTQLRMLHTSNNQLTELPESLGQLTQLQTLDISNNQLTELPESLGQLTQLQTLDISGNQLTELPEWLTQFTRLQSLDVGTESISQLPEWFSELRNLRSLYLGSASGSCPLKTLPDCIRHLKSLERLWPFKCGLSTLPDWIHELTELKELHLAYNQFVDIPSSLARLEHLDTLYLNDNPLNPELAAAHEEGLDAVKRYLRSKAGAEMALNEAKLILVGEGEVGKSCLLDALRGDPWMEHDSTHGIEIKSVKVKDPESGTEITLNAWDFGGQKVYRPTHQLFFSAPAVYLVVWKPREGPEQGFVKDWIKLVKHREPDAKIIVVATHGGPGQRQPDIGPQEYWELFGRDTLDSFFHVDSKPDETGVRRNIDELKDAIARLAAGLPEMGRTVPARWQQAREALMQTGAAYLPLERVLAICGEHKMDEDEAQLFVTISHRLGHLIHYEHDPILEDIVILKPDWLATAISFVLDDKQTRAAHGLVSFARLGELWDDPQRAPEFRYPASLHPIFLRLMERFDLSYRVAGIGDEGVPGRTSLIAQLVPDIRPDPIPGWAAGVAVGDGQQVQICRIVEAKSGQSATAEGLFYQLIVRLHKFSLGRASYDDSAHWQRGLVLDDDYNGRALMEHISNDIRITVRAPYPEGFLSVLTHEVKWLVESFWAGLRCEVLVPCVEPCGKNEPGRGVFEVQKLIAFKRQGLTKFPCTVSGCDQLQDIDCLLRNAPAAQRTSVEQLLAQNFGLMRARLDGVRDQLNQQERNAEERFRVLDVNDRRIMSQVEDAFRGVMQALTDEAKEGPRLFSLAPVSRTGFNPKQWTSEKFRLTLWCEHSRLPLPALNGEGDTSGVYELELKREWVKKAAPFLKVLGGTLSLVLPVASSATKLILDDTAYKKIEEELDFGQKSIEATVKGSMELGGWLGGGDTSGPERSEGVHAQGAVLRELHALLKHKDPGFGGLVRVQNKRQEFLWVHPQFEKEY